MKRVFPAVQYDAIVAKANEVGGVGAGAFYLDGCPVCLYGIASASWGGLTLSREGLTLSWGKLPPRESDAAVARLLGMETVTAAAMSRRRVPVLDLFAELGITRGK